ncbi:MAG: UbiD family decarboxylase [Candidatus Aenigmarchaeota archaeon]|nr:UbiD family decarboxylase [Candidatus Aenigmarchaeota archaeon]
MSFRDFLDKAESQGKLVKISKAASKKLEIPAVLAELNDKPVLFENVKESEFRVAGNLCVSKDAFANYFGIKSNELVPKMINAIANPSKPEVTDNAPCQEVEMEDVDLSKLPILFHCSKDGGNYVSSGVFVVRKGNGVQNLDYHRSMEIGKNRFSIRVVPNRDFDNAMKESGDEMDAVMCVGCSPNVLLGAATSVASDVDEMHIANTLEPLKIVKAKTSDLMVPADCEFVLEGKILKERADEGPFVDLTETYDVVRQEPVFEVRKITHRKDAIWHGLLPGKLEHRILMGMPREPTIFKKINEAGVKCLDVNVNPGGCSWLHGIVQIDKKSEDDGRKAIDAAFDGHKSMKHVFIVDSDININNPLEVEWAMSTRFQADRDMVVKENEKGSSLDPSSDPNTRKTTKVGFDFTMPVGEEKKHFVKAEFPKVDVKKFLE